MSRERRPGYVEIRPYHEPGPPSPWPLLLALAAGFVFAFLVFVALVVALVTWWGHFS